VTFVDKKIFYDGKKDLASIFVLKVSKPSRKNIVSTGSYEVNSVSSLIAINGITSLCDTHYISPYCPQWGIGPLQCDSLSTQKQS